MYKFFYGISSTLSLIFLPLLIPAYVFIWLHGINPQAFGVNSLQSNLLLLIYTIILTFLMPALAISLMKSLGLTRSFTLADRDDRIGPYIVSAIFYLWIFINFRNHPEIPEIFLSFLLGAVISLFVCFLVNTLKFKISLHSAGMGGFAAIMILCSSMTDWSYFNAGQMSVHLLVVIPFLLIASGAVLSSRIFLKAHSLPETIWGFGTGALSQLVSFMIIF